jgi:HPt (histidine-containing phosphotransfer) domain-containing protein
MNHSSATSAQEFPLIADAISCQSDELETIQRIFGDDYVQLATLYAADSPKRVAALREAVAAGDRMRVATHAHAFSGSCVSIGATGLSGLCRDLESCAGTADPGVLAEKLGLIETEYERICARMRTMIGPGA